MAQIPAVFKITPFIKRAEELEKDTSRTESQLVAYYWCSSYSFFLVLGGFCYSCCYSRFYALELAIKKQQELGAATP